MEVKDKTTYRGKGESQKTAQRGGPAVTAQEAARRNIRKARATTTSPAKEVVGTEGGKGAMGDMPGYIPTVEDRKIQEVYSNFVHSNDGEHLSGGIAYSTDWKI